MQISCMTSFKQPEGNENCAIRRQRPSRRRCMADLLLPGLVAAALACMAPLAVSAGDPTLEQTLQRAAKNVETFWNQLEEVDCTEQVSQTKLGTNGKVLYHQDSVFDYLLLPQKEAEELSLVEARQLQKQTGNAKNMPMLVTDGFSTLELVFHPYYQDSFEYTLLPADLLDGKTVLRVRFQHVRGARSPSVLRLRGRDYPLDLQGTAWMDPASGAILRIDAALAAPMSDVGLRVLHCDVRYAPVRFSSADTDYWLPASAEIEAETLKQHWRNIHRFTNYKRFSTSTQVEIQKLP